MPEGSRVDGPALLVSPHPDDCAYSVGGLVCEQAFGSSVFGVTVFSRSQATVYGEPVISKALGRVLRLVSQPRANRLGRELKVRQVTRMRRIEDSSYFTAIEAPKFDLGQLDAPLRGYGWSPFVSDVALVRDDPVNKVLGSRFRDLIDALATPATSSRTEDSDSEIDTRKCFLILPLGLGGHADHLITREVVSGLAKKHPRIYYEDLPYASRMSAEEVRTAANGFDRGLNPHLFSIEASLSKKIENLKLYKSQFGDKEAGLVVEYAESLGGGFGPCERLWYGQLPEESSLGKLLGDRESLRT